MSNQSFRDQFDPPLDPGIAHAVKVLTDAGVETYESCEGGEGHSYPEPAVRFHGDSAEGFRALALALQHALPVKALNRRWSIEDGEPVGPTWELVFWEQLASDDNHTTTTTPHDTPERTRYRLNYRLQTLGEIVEWVQLSEPGTVGDFTIDPGGEISGYQVIVLDAQTVSYRQTGHLVEEVGWKLGQPVEFAEALTNLREEKIRALGEAVKPEPAADEGRVAMLVSILNERQLWVVMRVMQAYEIWEGAGLNLEHDIIAELANQLGVTSQIARQAAELKVSGDPERGGAVFQAVDDQLLQEGDVLIAVIEAERHGESADH